MAQQTHPSLKRDLVPRPSTVLEPCVWALPPSAATEGAFWEEKQVENKLSSVTQARIRSVRSTEDCIINFFNEADVPVRAIWLDFHGNEVQYTVIEPKAQRRYRTFVTHPWIIREVATGQRMMLGQRMVVSGTANKEVKATIMPPPPLPWSLSTHKYYPAPFKKLVQILLLSHHRLRCSDSSLLLKELCLSTPALPPQKVLQCASAPSRFGKPEGSRKHECEPLLFASNSTASESTHNCTLFQVAPMCVCLEAICTYSSYCPPSLCSQSSVAPSLDSNFTAVAASSSSSVAMDEWRSSNNTNPSMDEDRREGSVPPESCIYCCPDVQQLTGSAATLAVAQRLRAQRDQHQYHTREDEEVSSPRSVLKASNKMLSWFVDKVARPMCAPKPQEPFEPKQHEGPFWRGTLSEMSELPTHLILHIISLMAPTNVPQCVSYQAPDACLDILPALLESDPATWPAAPVPTATADVQ